MQSICFNIIYLNYKLCSLCISLCYMFSYAVRYYSTEYRHIFNDLIMVSFVVYVLRIQTLNDANGWLSAQDYSQ